jgi:predicted PurR-regulated permease PerM
VSTRARGAIACPASRQSLGAHGNVIVRVTCAAVVAVLAVWVLNSFLLPVLVAGVTAIASWPLYERFAQRMPGRLSQSVTPLIFTVLMTTFVLAPLTFAFTALAGEAHTLLLAIAAADKQGIAAPQWLEKLPLAGSWLVERWQAELSRPGALLGWAQRTNTAALLGWAQSIGHFMARHVFIIGFAILVLFFLYQQGESIAADFRRLLARRIGEQAEHLLDVALRALRASVNSMLVVGLFDGILIGIVYAVAGAPHAVLWAAITGSLAVAPLVGYLVLAVLTLKLAMTGTAAPALLSFSAGCLVLFCGDKIVRPRIAREGTGLAFVWVLMGCLGGFEVLGLVGLVIGPVVLTLARELWAQSLRDVVSGTTGSGR